MEKKNWKETLLMPKTDFEMRAGLVKKEPLYRQQWLDNQIYRKSLEFNKEHGQGRFILHDGPPYANGNLHVGHAMNKILKDVIVRRKNMEGFYSPFVPGWDTHGLPIENKMLEQLKMTKDDLDQVTLRKEAAKYALTQVANQKEQFKQMQLFSDMEETYKTLDKSFEVGQLKLFKKMFMDGLIYKGLKPVYWSPSSESALAEAEVEYEDHRSPQVIVSFAVAKGNDVVSEGDNLLIMTTTPWTLIANSGVAVGENFDYSTVKVEDKIYVIATVLVDSVAQLVKWENFEIINTFKGSELDGVEYTRPIRREQTAPVILGHHVTTDAGTGLVHMAPLFGEDDYLVGKKHNLEMIMHVDNKGNLNSEAGEYEGLFYADANKNIGMFLDEKGELLSIKFIKHSYPHDWRTHKPVIYRGVPQWFVNIESIKEDIFKALEDVESKPSWGVDRIQKMIAGRTEWTISRQRTWGVPLIVFYDENEEPVQNAELFDYVIALVAEHGTDIWWEKSTDELLPEVYRGKGWTREMDIMDVWFDSGSSSISVKPEGQEGPFDLYLEGSDQYRGWFNSSLINSVAYRGVAPFKQMLSHGFVLDGKQQKMSKSKGNVVDPLKVISKNGADVLRLWAANSEYQSDVTISDDIIKQNSDIYRRIRNTLRFILGNLDDFDFVNDKVELEGIHLHMSKLTDMYANRIVDLYNEYSFQEIIKETNKFMIDLSGWYFDYAKDVLYTELANNVERRSIQTNMAKVIRYVMYALAPVLPTTIEEAYSHLNKPNKKESIFLERISTDKIEVELDEKFAKFFSEQRPMVNKVLEEARKAKLINRNNEAVLYVNIPADERIADEAKYKQFFMVADVIFAEETKVEVAEGYEKCQRCWNYNKDLNSENICERCASVVAAQ